MASLEAVRAQIAVKVHTTRDHKVLAWIRMALGRIAVVLISLDLCLPVILSPITTSIPSWAWIVLALADLGLIIFQFRVPLGTWSPAGFVAGIMLVSLITVALSQAFAATPPIKGPDGKALPGSIASLEKITLNGTEQWITIRGQDATRPILLNLGMGGPGGGGFTTRSTFQPLEKDFVVVSWDEPGTGKSYHALPISSLTPERFIEDGHALTLYLRERFHQDKIYLYGVSWTSILGIWLVQRYPELYYAYVGNAQMVNTTENDVMGYEFAIRYLDGLGDTAKADQLRRNGPPPYQGAVMLDKYVAYLDVLNEYMGSLPFTTGVKIVPFLAPEYGYVDKINHTRGLEESFQVVYPQLKDLDFIAEAPKLDVPVYIFTGRNDVNAMASLVQKYYDLLQAPSKRLTWLDGGHGLDSRNRAQFVDVMVNKVLPETYLSASK